MEQLEQPQPQPDLPFFLPFMLLTIINVTNAISANPTRIEPKFSINHIYFAPFLKYCFYLIFIFFLSGLMIARTNKAIIAIARISPIIPQAVFIVPFQIAPVNRLPKW